MNEDLIKQIVNLSISESFNLLLQKEFRIKDLEKQNETIRRELEIEYTFKTRVGKTFLNYIVKFSEIAKAKLSKDELNGLSEFNEEQQRLGSPYKLDLKI